MRGRALLAAVMVVAMVATPSLAVAQSEEQLLSEAAEELRNDPVHVASDAGSILSDAEEQDVTEQVEAAEPTTGDVYVAVFPEGAGDPQALATRLHDDHVARAGTYAVVSGDDYFAGSDIDLYGEGTVPALMEEAVRAESGSDAGAVLSDFVSRLQSTAAQIEAQDPPGGAPSGDGFGISPLFLIILIVGGAFLFMSWRRRRERADLERRHFEEVKEAAMEDLVALGEDLRALDLDVEMPGVEPAAKDDYVKGLGCYERATAQIDQARRIEELEPVSSALEEGRYAMARAKARLEGREPPERRAPCFFDPRHGPSVRDVEWSPPHGARRTVPACHDCALAIEEGREPQAREVLVDGRPTPYWNAPYYYGPWAGGYFGGFGLLEGLFLGSMLGGVFDHGHDYAGDFGGNFGGDSGGDFGGGDFGGGDFGGGDFGGGDF